jgi:hypothetical protein
VRAHHAAPGGYAKLEHLPHHRPLILPASQPRAVALPVAPRPIRFHRVAGGVLAGIEDRLSAIVLLGGIVSEAEHNRAASDNPYWQVMRRRMTPDEFTRTLEKIETTDPARFLPLAKAPILVQCGRLDTPDNVKDCPKVHDIAGGARKLVWYDEDHHFTSWEAARDRLNWLARYLSLRNVQGRLRDFMRP